MGHYRIFAVALIIGILTAVSNGCGGVSNTTLPNSDELFPDFTSSQYHDPGRKLLGLWYFDFQNQTVSTTGARTLLDRMNIADVLLMPEYADALNVEIENFSEFGDYAPPAVSLNIKLNNYFGVTGWNIRGIFLDNTGNVHLRRPDGYTNQWDDGGNIKVNAFLEFSAMQDGSFPNGTSVQRSCILECPSNQVPAGLWFAVDAGIDGPYKSARAFPLSSMNGTFRWPNDEAELIARVNGTDSDIKWVAALTGKFAGKPTFLQYEGISEGDRVYKGILHYIGGLGGGEFPLYFAAWWITISRHSARLQSMLTRDRSQQVPRLLDAHKATMMPREPAGLSVRYLNR